MKTDDYPMYGPCCSRACGGDNRHDKFWIKDGMLLIDLKKCRYGGPWAVASLSNLDQIKIRITPPRFQTSKAYNLYDTLFVPKYGNASVFCLNGDTLAFLEALLAREAPHVKIYRPKR